MAVLALRSSLSASASPLLLPLTAVWPFARLATPLSRPSRSRLCAANLRGTRGAEGNVEQKTRPESACRATVRQLQGQ